MADWNRTITMDTRLLPANGIYAGRPIIHRDTPIDGGVYLGANEREAIVVDSSKDSAITKLYQTAQQRLKRDFFRGHGILRVVYDVVGEQMTYSEFGVQRLFNDQNIGADQKIRLGHFIENQIGVCRHQALAVGILFELFKRDGLVRGRPSIDRNEIGILGAHTWVRYFSGHEEIYIIDVAQRFLGTLKESASSGWDYFRPGEKRS